VGAKLEWSTPEVGRRWLITRRPGEARDNQAQPSQAEPAEPAEPGRSREASSGESEIAVVSL
jgi:hypothetical protein